MKVESHYTEKKDVYTVVNGEYQFVVVYKDDLFSSATVGTLVG